MSFKVRQVHLEIIINFMETHKDLAKGRLNNAQAMLQYKKLWEELADQLNAADFEQKSIEKWQKTWRDFKHLLKKKAADIEKNRNLTGGGPGAGKVLTDIEIRILSILGNSFYRGTGTQEIGISHDQSGNYGVSENMPSSEVSDINTCQFSYLEEDNSKKVYSETVDILNNINHNMTIGLKDICESINTNSQVVNNTLTVLVQNMENLAKEVQACKELLENNS